MTSHLQVSLTVGFELRFSESVNCPLTTNPPSFGNAKVSFSLGE